MTTIIVALMLAGCMGVDTKWPDDGQAVGYETEAGTDDDDGPGDTPQVYPADDGVDAAQMAMGEPKLELELEPPPERQTLECDELAILTYYKLDTVYKYQQFRQTTHYAEFVLDPNDDAYVLICHSDVSIPSCDTYSQRPDLYADCLIELTPDFRYREESCRKWQPIFYPDGTARFNCGTSVSYRARELAKDSEGHVIRDLADRLTYEDNWGKWIDAAVYTKAWSVTLVRL